LGRPARRGRFGPEAMAVNTKRRCPLPPAGHACRSRLDGFTRYGDPNSGTPRGSVVIGARGKRD